MKLKFLAGILLASLAMSSCDDNTEDIGTSLVSNLDGLDVNTDTFSVSSRSIIVDSVYSRSNLGYLGRVKDPETNSYVIADFMTQFHIFDNYSFPQKEKIISLKDGQIVADSCEIRLYYDKFFGDSLSTMKLSAYELTRPMLEDTKYSSSFDPFANGYIDESKCIAQRSYALANLSATAAERKSDDYTANICIPLNQPYTDKNGNTYNNYGSYIMNEYYKNPKNFENSIKLINNVIPGFYFKSTGGVGSMAYIFTSQLLVYFRYNDNDSIYDGVTKLAGTEEVLQTSRIINERKTLLDLVADNTCTYIKAPAGIYTEMTLPVDEILANHQNDSVMSAKLTIPRINNSTTSEYSLGIPQTLIMVPKDSLNAFFVNERLINNRTSFYAHYTSSNNSYTFSNIGNLISAMNRNRESENWNKVVLVPVTISTNASSVITKVSCDMSLASTRLVGGSQNPHSPVKISVIYSKFK
ncbi:MAG: DUF4270 domain-containing protein [Prevotella sp.]|nr:DUF4270 domain-containing protein [Prevotella sp.]